MVAEWLKKLNLLQVNEETSVDMKNNESTVPQTSSRKQVKRQSDSIAREAYHVMESLQNKRQDEFAVYGELITQYHRNQILCRTRNL